MTGDEFWNDRFHTIALAVGFVAHAEGWLHDSERVRRVAYHLYERGEWPPDDSPPPRTDRATQTGCANGRDRVLGSG